MAAYKIITAIWVSTGIDPDGNPVPKHKWDESVYPTLGDFLVEEYGMTAQNFFTRVNVLSSLPIFIVSLMARPTDPEDTSHVVEYHINYDLPTSVFDETLAALRAELAVREANALVKGYKLILEEHDE